MITFKEAQNIISKVTEHSELMPERVPLEKASGRIVAQNIIAPIDIQPFDNSAMDGYAVLCSDLKDASPQNSVKMTQIATIAAGDPTFQQEITSGNCFQIMTGAPIPPKTEAIVPIELVKIHKNIITFLQPPQTGKNIRRSGEDFKVGETILKKGTLITTSHILPLATLGINEVSVFKKPKIALLETGCELVDDLSLPLQPGQIYNSNCPYSKALLKSMGCDVHSLGTIRDNLQSFSEKLKEVIQLNADITISSGAVSVGVFDFVKEGLIKAGAEILYHKVKVKPGKPILLARLPNGSLYFGLPGNPVANAIGLRFFVFTALRTMTEQEPEIPLHAKISKSYQNNSSLHTFLKGYAETQNNGIMEVKILEKQSSFMVSPFLKMNCWICIKDHNENIENDEIVDIYPLIPTQ